MKVKNINGTCENNCKCLSWLEHWKKHGGGTIYTYCAVLNCIGKAQVGAHVQKDDYLDNNWYIVPFCSSHNQRGGVLDIHDFIRLVPANVSRTCGTTPYSAKSLADILNLGRP